MQIRIRGQRRHLETPQEMIRETSQFLTWALPRADRLPRMPIRPVSQGGFAELIRIPGARARVNRWWDVCLDRLERAWDGR